MVLSVALVAAIATFSDYTASPQPTVLPFVAGPVVNGISLADPGYGDEQAFVAIGLLDVTKPPFSADKTGAVDATAAIQAAVDAGRLHYLTVLFPAGNYTVSDTIRVIQPAKAWKTTNLAGAFCNNIDESFGAPVKNTTHCARTAPVVMTGSKATQERPMIVLKEGLGFASPVVQLHNPINENINMNQLFTGIDIKISDGNQDATGIYARGAQGVSVQDVTIYAGNGKVGLVGGAGSGGSHINVTVIGGDIGMDLSQSQPAPTLTSITLIGQKEIGILYTPGRQTLIVTGLVVEGVQGSSIVASASVSVIDSKISGADSSSGGIVSSNGAGVFLQNVWFNKVSNPVTIGDTSIVAGDAGGWLQLETVAAGAGVSNTTAAVYNDGVMVASPLVERGASGAAAAPPPTLTTQHGWPADFPTWESPGACMASDYGAVGDFVTDDTAALNKMLSDPKCAIAVLHKGYFAVTSTVLLPEGTALVGVGRIYSNIVPHGSVNPTIPVGGAAPWPLLMTHVNSTYAVHWTVPDGVWRRAHTNRVDLSPGKFPYAKYNQPLSKMTAAGGGKFWNFYQENWNFQ
eukprot:gene6211-27391_t